LNFGLGFPGRWALILPTPERVWICSTRQDGACLWGSAVTSPTADNRQEEGRQREGGQQRRELA
jgi:hypothetical protein